MLFVWHCLKGVHSLQADATRRLPGIREAIIGEAEYYLGYFREGKHSPVMLARECPLESAERLLALLVALDKLRSPEEEGALALYGATAAANATPCPLHGSATRHYYVVLRRNHYPACSRNAEDVDSLLAWHPNHAFIPVEHDSWRIGLKNLSQSAEKRLSAKAHSGQPLRLFVADFSDGVRLVPPPATGPYFTTGLDQPERRKLAIFEALESAKGQAAQMVVLPELAVTPALREEISVWLDDNEHPFLLIVPGSFHQIENDEKRNLAHLMDFMGVSVLVHRKLTRYGKWGDIHEDLNPGAIIEVIDTPFGLLAMPICKDLSDEGRMKTGVVWAELGCDLLLVPSMAPAAGMRAHQRAADTLGRRLNGVIAVANQWDGPETDSHRSLVHSPRIVETSRVEGGGNLHCHLLLDIQFSAK